MHKIHLVAGKRESTTDVVIAEAGAVPAKVELGTPGAPARPVAATPSATPAATPGTTSQTAPPEPPHPPPPPPPPPAKTNKPPVDREFK
jgi:hypothetical protein